MPVKSDHQRKGKNVDFYRKKIQNVKELSVKNGHQIQCANASFKEKNADLA